LLNEVSISSEWTPKTELRDARGDNRSEFGNYIGNDLDSDDDASEIEVAQASTSVQGQAGPSAQAQAPMDGYDDDEDAEMMDVDGGQNGQRQIQDMDGVGTSKS